MFSLSANRLRPLALSTRARCLPNTHCSLPIGLSHHQRLIHVAPSPTHPSETKGVVIMYGWLGSKPSQVEKYAKLYQDRGCTVVYDIAPFKDAVVRNPESLDAVASRSAIKAADIIKEIETEKAKASPTNTTEEIPVLLHYFSNGGAFVAERLRHLINEAKTQDVVQEDNCRKESDKDAKVSLKMISDRLYEKGYEVVDSAPADIHENLQKDVIESAISNQYLQIAVKKAAQIHQFIFNFFGMSHEKMRANFWNNMVENDLCLRQAFIYSANDRIADPKMIDQLVEARKTRGIDVISTRFEESDHVSHFRHYPEEYSNLVDQVIKAVFRLK